MRLGPRAKLLLLAALFALPVVASFLAWRFMTPQPTANYGELLAATPVTTQPFERPGGGRFEFAGLRGRWLLVASDSGRCEAACRGKLVAMRQVRLALGRNATRVERVFVVDDLRPPDPAALAELEGMQVALTPRGMTLPAGAANDRAHLYLVDPRGNVMMRWPVEVDAGRMLKDLRRLLKASQIG
jgi:cytochrome oxidase Cu insertion factor (SCO1/SenC/PrrC family)